MDSMTKSTKPPESSLDPAAIVAWLRANPQFLQEYPEVCEFLLPPQEKRGKGVVDFQSYMIRRLKTDQADLIGEARDIVETSRANMNSQTRFHRAVLMLLEARNFEDFIHVLTMDLASLLDVDIITIVVEAEGTVIPHITMPGVRIVSEGTVDLVMAGRTTILESNIGGLEQLYGGGAGLVKSQTLLRLNIAQDAPPTILAFGSRDPNYFSAGQGTELVSFLGHAAERMFLRWMG
jgi:uncharacterized protein YigA (DUF484 family)